MGSEQKPYGMRKITERVPDGRPKAVSRLEIDQGIKNARNKNEEDHQCPFQKTGIPVIEMPQGKSDIPRDCRVHSCQVGAAVARPGPATLVAVIVLGLVDWACHGFCCSPVGVEKVWQDPHHTRY